jgi:hypothetical protein
MESARELYERWPDPPKDQDVPLVATLEELIRLAPSSPQLWVRAELANTIAREQVAAEEAGRTVSAMIRPWPRPQLGIDYETTLQVAADQRSIVYKLAETPHVSSHEGRGGLHDVWDAVAGERVPCFLAHWPD